MHPIYRKPKMVAMATSLRTSKSAESSSDSLTVKTRDVNETLAYETETRHLVFGPRRDRDQDLPAILRDRDV